MAAKVKKVVGSLYDVFLKTEYTTVRYHKSNPFTITLTPDQARYKAELKGMQFIMSWGGTQKPPIVVVESVEEGKNGCPGKVIVRMISTVR